MLCLTRRREQTIRIGKDIEVMVVDIRGRDVRLGITAPAHVIVDREEVWERKRRAGRRMVKK